MNTKQFIEKEGLYGLTPRTRCVCCKGTVAQIRQSYDRYAIIEGQYLDCGGDHITAIDKSKEGWICGPCLEVEETEPAASAILYHEGMDYHFRIGEYAVIETGDDDIPGKLFEEIIRPYAQLLKWHPTDQWRGCYQSSFNTTWQKVIHDWYGTLDGYNLREDNDIGRFHTLYERKKDIPDFPLLVCFPRTSNVCAGNVEVFVRKANSDKFRAWLGVDQLETEGD